MNQISSARNRFRLVYQLYVPGKLRAKVRYVRGRSCYSEHNDVTKSIFIHIPKTAGSSVSQALFSDMRIAHTHYSAQEYFDESAKKYSEFVKFAFVRNPIERFVSAYKHLLSPPEWVHQDSHAFSQDHVRPYADINDFVRHLEEDWLVREWVHFKPQTRFLLVNDEININFIGRFENLDIDIKKVAELLGVSGRVAMPHVNRSKNIVDKSMKLTPGSLRVLKDFYSDDFRKFGYDP